LPETYIELLRLFKEESRLHRDQIAHFQSTVDSLQATVDSLNQTITEQRATIEELNRIIRELTEQKNKDSHNSSKPPSSDGLKKPSPKSLRKPSGKKQGGQPGHPGTNLMVIDKPTEVIKHMPELCSGCPHYQECLTHARVCETRHVIDAEVKVSVIAHEVLQVTDCPCHNGTLKGDFPSDVNAYVQYGVNLQALAIALNTVGAVSYNRASEILRGMFNIPISKGTISAMVSRLAGSLDGTMEQIRQALIDSKLKHCDETGTRVDGKTNWVHVVCNDLYTYLTIHRKRGYDGMISGNVLPNCSDGILVHDCWVPYWKFPQFTHALCNAHLLRELVGVAENHPDTEWATDFTNLLMEMKKVRDQAIAKGESCLSYYYINKFSKRYDEVIEKAYRENPEPEATEKRRGRKKRGKVLALIDRLKKYKASICLFIKDLTVPFDNNPAERDIRMVKTKTKVSGCFRSDDGSVGYFKIMSYVGTAKKHGHNAYNAILAGVKGHPECCLVLGS